ncbi:hypothetical protein [Streptomyces sp. AP-93]|uniref:hypothetical protein n=1 Tax=Streptomyces sp. AP-93 TaxID=2929048 RepID=UPI001FB034DA|nr:hypothetical protein [Streptomyces sp. AP-93]MCJ0869300.1 hypothetical protein [Streptomyces sp. AP-93]
MVYSKAKAAQLASHITRACPTGETRPVGKTCDEYPLATSAQRMSAGGARRTFSGCSITGVPTRTGTTGAGACMISENDQDYQGGITGTFNRPAALGPLA